MPVHLNDYVFSNVNLLTKILQDEYKDNNMRVTDFNATNACKKGENFMSKVQRLHITGTNGKENTENSEIKKDMILKIRVNDKKSDIISTQVLWKCERFVYQTLVSRFEEICQDSFAFPKYYHGDEDIILLEDLKVKGYYVRDKRIGMDLESSLIVMDKLAKFHSCSILLRKEHPEEFEELVTTYEHPYSTARCIQGSYSFIEQHVKTGIDLVNNSVPEPKKYEALLKHIRGLVDIEKMLHLENYEDTPNPVFIHGDLWGNNIMFVDKDGKVDDAALLDFQATRPGSATKDLLYFIYTSVESTIRAESFDQIVQHYFDRRNYYLKQWLKSDVDVDEEFSFAKFQEEMFKYKYYGLLNAMLSLPAMVYDGDYDFFTIDKNNNDSKYRDRLIGIVEEYLEKGWNPEDEKED